MVACLKEGKVLDFDKEMPQLKVSTNTDAATKKREDEAFEKAHERALDRHYKRLEVLHRNLKRVYADIWADYCTEKMQTKLMQIPEFDTKIVDNPFELMNAISPLNIPPLMSSSW